MFSLGSMLRCMHNAMNCLYVAQPAGLEYLQVAGHSDKLTELSISESRGAEVEKQKNTLELLLQQACISRCQGA